MTHLINRLRLFAVCAALAAVLALPSPVHAKAVLDCGMDNVCCGQVSDLACSAYVMAALGHCCGGGSGNAACWDDVFYVYCNPGGSKYCECNKTGDNCEMKQAE